jgi:hypothetical protein
MRTDVQTVFEMNMSQNPIYDNVHGAPSRIGESVRVHGSQDETFDPSYKRRVGTIEYFEYECGCGQSYPNDPMIGVKFRDGKTAEFWAEELRRHHASAKSKSLSVKPADNHHHQEIR